MDVKELLKQIYPIIITGACAVFAVFIYFADSGLDDKGVFVGSGAVFEEMVKDKEQINSSFDVLENQNQDSNNGTVQTPKIKYIGGAGAVGGATPFKKSLSFETSQGEVLGDNEEYFTIYLLNILNANGESAYIALDGKGVEELEEVSASVIYDYENDLFYFLKSGVYVVKIKVYDSNGLSFTYNYSLPVEVN